jgi:hypothetical protein
LPFFDLGIGIGIFEPLEGLDLEEEDFFFMGDSCMMEENGIELRGTSHPETGGFLARLWLRLRCAVWPYDVSRASVETVEIEITDAPKHGF